MLYSRFRLSYLHQLFQTIFFFVCMGLTMFISQIINYMTTFINFIIIIDSSPDFCLLWILDLEFFQDSGRSKVVQRMWALPVSAASFVVFFKKKLSLLLFSTKSIKVIGILILRICVLFQWKLKYCLCSILMIHYYYYLFVLKNTFLFLFVLYKNIFFPWQFSVALSTFT